MNNRTDIIEVIKFAGAGISKCYSLNKVEENPAYLALKDILRIYLTKKEIDIVEDYAKSVSFLEFNVYELLYKLKLF